MKNCCKQICSTDKYKTEREVSGHKRYASGYKFCYHCHYWIVWEGRRCPCCGKKLRTRPENKKYRIPFYNTKDRNGST